MRHGGGADVNDVTSLKKLIKRCSDRQSVSFGEFLCSGEGVRAYICPKRHPMGRVGMRDPTGADDSHSEFRHGLTVSLEHKESQSRRCDCLSLIHISEP